MSYQDWLVAYSPHTQEDPIKKIFYGFFCGINYKVINYIYYFGDFDNLNLAQINELDYSILSVEYYAPYLHLLMNLINKDSYILIDLFLVSEEARTFFRDVFLLIFESQDPHYLPCIDFPLHRSDLFLAVTIRPFSQLFISERSIIETFVRVYNVLYPYYDNMPDDLALDLERLQRYYDAWDEDDAWEEENGWAEEIGENWHNGSDVPVSAFSNLSLRTRSHV